MQGIPFRIPDFRKIQLGNCAGSRFQINDLGILHERLTNAIRLSPRDPGLERWYGLLGIADLFLGRLELALERLRKSAEMNPNPALTQFFLAAASALTGRAAEAQEARNAGLRLDPNFTVARFRDEPRSKNATFLAQRERIYEGLSMAGVPEGSK